MGLLFSENYNLDGQTCYGRVSSKILTTKWWWTDEYLLLASLQQFGVIRAKNKDTLHTIIVDDIVTFQRSHLGWVVRHCIHVFSRNKRFLQESNLTPEITPKPIQNSFYFVGRYGTSVYKGYNIEKWESLLELTAPKVSTFDILLARFFLCKKYDCFYSRILLVDVEINYFAVSTHEHF